jgi:aspartate/methionine/tyrosine aminotransferase
MRQAVHELEASKIREVANAGLGRSDVLAFWFGEGDVVTPDFIRQAAMESLQRGETFYSHNLGLPELRQAVADMLTEQHGGVNASRIAMTSGGVNALMIAVQTVVDPGDKVVCVEPVWPNLPAQALILGARLEMHGLVVKDHAWTLDVDALIQQLGSDTRLLILNAPNNPTGWTLSREDQARLMAHCRQHGIWILSDEVYSHLYYEDSANGCAPSFLDHAHADDRVIVVGSFSKSFWMTGWRLGWLVLPESLTEHVGKLIEFNTSCLSVFVQRAGLAALSRRSELVSATRNHLRQCRDTLVPALNALPGLHVATPAAGLYAFFSIPGHSDGLDVAKRLVKEAGLGLAPGEAFGDRSSGWLRWCFATEDLGRLREGVSRLQGWLGL